MVTAAGDKIDSGDEGPPPAPGANWYRGHCWPSLLAAGWFAPIRLTSLSDDIAALEGALERTKGPLVLAAHAYAGAVIAAINARESNRRFS